MFSTDFIFRQQENLVDNQKCQAGFRRLCNKILLFTQSSRDSQNLAQTIELSVLLCNTLLCLLMQPNQYVKTTTYLMF